MRPALVLAPVPGGVAVDTAAAVAVGETADAEVDVVKADVVAEEAEVVTNVRLGSLRMI